MQILPLNYWLMWLSFVVSSVGTYTSLIVINLFIYKATGSAFLVGVFLLLRLIPSFFMGSLAGVFADRFNRKHLMIIADVIRACFILSIIFVRGEIYPLYLFIFIISICDRLFQASLGASIPNVVGKEKIIQANSYLSAGRTIALIAGPLLGGLLVSLGRLEIAFIMDAATYVFSAALISRINASLSESKTKIVRKSMWHDIREGYGFLLGKTALVGALLLRCLDAFGSSALNVGLPIFSSKRTGLSSGLSYGLLFAAFGVGEMIGSLFLSRSKWVISSPPEKILGVSVAVMALGFGLSLNMGTFYYALLFLFICGLAEGVTVVHYNSILQNSPDNIRGRVVGISETGVWGSMAVGMFLSGLFIEKLDVGLVVGAFALLIIIGSVLYLSKGGSIQNEARAILQKGY